MSTTLDRPELERVRAFVRMCRWTFARTVPRHPWLPDEALAEFDWFAALIGKRGYRKPFNAAPGDNAGASGIYTYLNVDGRRYWITPTIDRTSLIVNRASLEDAGEQLRLIDDRAGR